MCDEGTDQAPRATPGRACGEHLCMGAQQAYPGNAMKSDWAKIKRGLVETINGTRGLVGPPPPSPPQRASNLRPRDETPVHFQYAISSMCYETSLKPPIMGDGQNLGGQAVYSKTPHQHQHTHRAACAVASTSREDAAHRGAGPPCTFWYALSLN